jgi:hypothetical protein
VEEAGVTAGTYIIVQLATGGAGSETIVGQYLVAPVTGSTVTRCYRPIFPPIPVAISTRIACKTADSVGAQAKLITLECIAQSNVVDDAIPVTTVTTVTNQLTAAQIATGVWQDATAGDFTTASSIGKSVMNGVTLGTGLTINAYTGNTVQTGDAFAIVKSGGTGDNAAIKAKTDLIPAAPASTTNITAGTITTVSGNVTGSVGSVSGAVGSVTGAVGSVAGNVGGNVVGSVGSVTGLTASNLDTTVSSRSTYAGGAVASVTGAVGSVTGNVGGNVTGSVGSVVGLTASNLDATVSSRLAAGSYTAPDNASVTAIKGKTDSLNFTTAGEVDANIHSVNDTVVVGDGSATPWGPA